MSRSVTSRSDIAGENEQPADFWISCIEGPEIPMEPGRLIYRNAGNIVSPLDISCLAAMDMAIRKFGVRKIVVCGHHECRCIEVEAFSGISGQWLVPIKRIGTGGQISPKPDRISSERQRSEENVIEQARSVAATSVVKEAVAAGKQIEIIGLIFDPKTDELLTLVEL